MAATKKNRSRFLSFQFGIKTLACVCLMIAFAFGWLSWQIRDAKVRWNRVSALRADGWLLLYESNGPGLRKQIPEPSWSPVWIKNHLFSYVTSIHITKDEPPTSLKFLNHFPHLEHLSVSYSENFEDLSGLANVPKLRTLIINECSKVKNIDAICNLKNLEFLRVEYLNLAGIAPGTFDGLENLKGLDTNCFTGQWNLEALSTLENLESLSLSASEEITNVDVLKSCKNLRELDLFQCRALENLDGLIGLKELEELNLGNCSSLKNIDGLADTTRVKKLVLESEQLESIDGLRNMSSLEELNISCSQITDLKALEGLDLLEELILQDCDSLEIEDLAPLANLKGLQRLAIDCLVDLKPELEDFRSQNPDIEVVLEH